MPGFVDRHLDLPHCPDCGVTDPWNIKVFLHKPTCPTQPGHEQAQAAEDERHRRRREYLDALVNSREAKRLRKLRSIGRLT